MELRRVLPRQPTDWLGTYMLDGDGDGTGEKPWRRCRVVDVSTRGAGLVLFDALPEEARDHRIIVSVQLRGDVRSALSVAEGRVRAGIEFTDLTGTSVDYLQSLRDLGARW